MVSLKISSSLDFEIKKSFLSFVFFEELSRIEVLCEHVIFGMISFTFSVIFLQSMIFSLKIFHSKKNFTPQKESFMYSYYTKDDKKTSSGVIGKFTIKNLNSI